MALYELKEENAKPCRFCNSSTVDDFNYGTLFIYEDLVLHYYCLIFSEPLEQNGRDEEGVMGFLKNDILRCLTVVNKNICCYCGGPNASISCSKANCSAIFHFPCGKKNGSLHQFMGRFNSFCSAHKPKQRIQSAVLAQAQECPPICLICLEVVNHKNTAEALYVNCCRFTWYHRDCLQKMAISAGLLFKCVKCSNKTKFTHYLKRHGIHIPKQDASWELEAGSYQGLYWQYDQCDAEDCDCPFGRTYNEKEWTVIRCRLCGSQGIHIACAKFGDAPRLWECEDCREVASRTTSNSNPSGEADDMDVDNPRQASKATIVKRIC